MKILLLKQTKVLSQVLFLLAVFFFTSCGGGSTGISGNPSAGAKNPDINTPTLQKIGCVPGGGDCDNTTTISNNNVSVYLPGMQYGDVAKNNDTTNTDINTSCLPGQSCI